MNGNAWKFTIVPAHTGFASAAINTETGSNGFTVMLMLLDVAGLPEVFGRLEVSTHTTTSPSEGAYE